MNRDICLHEDVETHLWYGTFAELAAKQIDPNEDRVLLLSEIEGEVEAIQSEIETVLEAQLGDVQVYKGDQDNLPMPVDSFDVTVCSSHPRRQLYERHQPLYQISSVTRRGGTIIYKAEQGLPHSDAVALDQIHAIDWEGDHNPLLAAEMTVVIDGKYNPTGNNEELDVNVPIQTDEDKPDTVEKTRETPTTEDATLELFV